MTVALSMLTLVPGAMGGSETYARELVRELAARRRDVYSVVSPGAAGFSQGLPEVIVNEFRTGRSTLTRTRALLIGAVRHRHLSRHLERADIVHYPFTVGMPPPRHGQRTVVSLLDVQHHDLPNLFSRAERVYRHVTYDRWAARADVVVTLSEFAKSRIVHRLGIEPERVHVAYLGVRADQFTPQTGPRENFLLYPAKAWPHKNHERLFDAFRIIRERGRDLELILTGARSDELPSLPVGARALGQVPFRDLLGLYGSAAALVFPSRYEGFGLPAVEAMARGCPVAVARSGSLPEVVGDAGVLFDADDPDDIARGVTEALERSQELQVAGIERAKRFTWSSCADVHEEVYRRLGR